MRIKALSKLLILLWLFAAPDLPAIQAQVQPGRFAPAPAPVPNNFNALPPAQIQAGQPPLNSGTSQFQSVQAAPGMPVPQFASSSRGLAPRVRIKDITTIEGHQSYTVSGQGLVNGLQGTGAGSPQTQQAVLNYFKRQGLVLPQVATKNMAIVEVSGEVPPFLRRGQFFEVRVSALDDSVSLTNGELALTILETIDGEQVASTKGTVSTGGFAAQGNAGSIFKNHVTVGTINAKLQVDISQEPPFPRNKFAFLLNNSDLTTAVGIADAINKIFPGIAKARDAGAVDVYFPRPYLNQKVEFVSMVQQLLVVPDMRAKVTVDRRTGVILIGQNVRITPTTFAHYNLVITTTEGANVSQPAPFSNGETVVVPQTQLQAKEINSRFHQFPTVGDLAAGLNALGVPPSDVITVLEGLRSNGALQATLEFR